MEPSTDLIVEAKQPEYRRIADGLRSEILNKKWTPGTQLPATGTLATTWKTSYCTIHTALKTLAKEGWIDRIRGAGTYVAEPTTRFICAGIFHSFDISSNEHSPFSRSMQSALLRQLAILKKEAQIFTDPRPYEKQGPILPALADAISHRRIQCLVGLTLNSVDSPALAQLPIPTAFTSNPYSPNQAQFDWEGFFRESLQRLAAQGCRSVGVISNILPPEEDVGAPSFDHYFHRAVRDAGLVTRESWFRRPTNYIRELPEFGYQEFRHLWQQPEKPDAVIVYPDLAASGAVIAILETGMKLVTERMKFVFHRNAHLKFLCPLPVTWAITDEDILARGLIELIERQFAGKKGSPILLPYQFRDDRVDPPVAPESN